MVPKYRIGVKMGAVMILRMVPGHIALRGWEHVIEWAITHHNALPDACEKKRNEPGNNNNNNISMKKRTALWENPELTWAESSDVTDNLLMPQLNRGEKMCF
ncbi:hypothetical protein AVEN_87470-1 [Araneus ventricosus]|uniref:Uncharacterized protein n=1 Tax=Araneus ventricosus TaxID=182803 RepID=A0A4Y2SDN4_ARAVE|nr:hypothetical protein AVEN_87470-1 [Araneus ventricosus]